jgi:LDH2 family malate/lactate/ureidoglycolate dehydrogenase
MAGPERGARVSAADLVAFAEEVLQRIGLLGATAHLVADTLVDADARGIGSHGLVRLPIYVKRIQGGLVDPAAVPTVEIAGAVASVDAHNCVGALAARAGMDAAVERSEQLGLGFARVRHSNHAGALGYYARAAALRGFVVIAASNAPLTMAYFGGRTRAVGTNPFAIAVPRRDGPPILLDVATSAVARGKIIVAAADGRAIPEGWAIDVDGTPTTDAHKALAGSVLPFGGPKGSGLAMMIDLFCGVLAGADFGRHIGDMYENWARPQNVGHVFFAVHPDDLDGTFLPRVEDFVGDVVALPPAAGSDRILLPGEVEEMALATALRDGVPVAASTAVALAKLAAELEIGVPPFLAPSAA